MATRRRTTYWLAGLTIAVVAAATIFGRQRIAEEWYIYQLRSGDQAVVDNAAMRLGEMKSVRAIEPLVTLVPGELADEPHVYFSPITNAWHTNSRVLKALHDLGERARVAAGKVARRQGFLSLPQLVYDPDPKARTDFFWRD